MTTCECNKTALPNLKPELDIETLKDYAIFIASLKVAQEYLAYCKPQFVEYYCKKYDALHVKDITQMLAKAKGRDKYKAEVEKDFDRFDKIIDNLTNAVEKTDSGNLMIQKFLDNFCEFAKYLKDNMKIVE